MKRKFIVVLSLFVAIFMCAAYAEAAVKVTVRNNLSHNLSFAFCWAGFDYEDDVSKGWYNVKAGETRTITFTDAKYSLTSENFGYYATGTPSGGKKLYWRGQSGNDYMTYWIHPGKAFTGSHNNPIEGGKKESFRKIKLTKTSDADGSATITFNP